jgi:hypothetical protein
MYPEMQKKINVLILIMIFYSLIYEFTEGPALAFEANGLFSYVFVFITQYYQKNIKFQAETFCNAL